MLASFSVPDYLRIAYLLGERRTERVHGQGVMAQIQIHPGPTNIHR